MDLIGLDEEIAKISSRDTGPHSHIWMRMRKWDTGIQENVLKLIVAEVVTDVQLPGTLLRRRAGLHRAELLQILYEAVQKNPDIKMHTNRRLAGLEKVSNSEMRLDFQDGSTATANLVVGADGIHSVVRGHYLKDEAIFSGIVAYRGLVPMEEVVKFWDFDDSDVSGLFTQQGKHFMTYVSCSLISS